MYESGTSEAGSSDLTSDPRAAFLGVGKLHGESSPKDSLANKPLPPLFAGLASSSKREEDCFGRAGKSSSPKRDIVMCATAGSALFDECFILQQAAGSPSAMLSEEMEAVEVCSR